MEARFPYVISAVVAEDGKLLGHEFSQNFNGDDPLIYHLSDKRPAPRSGRLPGYEKYQLFPPVHEEK